MDSYNKVYNLLIGTRVLGDAVVTLNRHCYLKQCSSLKLKETIHYTIA